jgi:hypothetical protein
MSFKFPLPDSIVKLIDKADREKLGLKTMDEHVAEAEVKTERELSNQVENLLRLRGIQYFKSRSDKRTTRPKGEPDFLMSVWVKSVDKRTQTTGSWPVAIGFELKVGGRALSDEQQAMIQRMTTPPNAWKIYVIRSVQDAFDALKQLGL